MKLIKFPEQTVVIAENQKEYHPLPAFQFANDPMGRTVCCWQLTWWERIRLLFAGKLWHTVCAFHQPLQPQMLELKKPFTSADVVARQVEQKAIESRQAFQKALVDKYGDAIRKRSAHMDALNYHANDRRRCVKLDPDDFRRCREMGILFLGGMRIVDQDYKSAV